MGSRIYIDLQSIFDLRQSVLAQMMGHEAAAEYVTSEEYNFRDTDTFPVDMETFSKMLSDESGVAMKHTTITYMEIVLKSKLDTLEKRNAFNQTSEQAEILLNIFPYHLTTEQAEKIRLGLFIKLGEKCKITVIRDPLEKWTPAYMKSLGLYAFMGYNFGAWLSHHTSKMETTELREIHLYFPALGQEKLTKEEAKQIGKLGFKDIFGYTEYLFSSVTKLTFLPPIFYTNVITATAHLEKNKAYLNEPLTQSEEGKENGNLKKSS